MGEAQDHIVRTVRAAMKEQDTESREKKEEQKSKERVADQIDKAIRTVMKDYDIKAKNHKQKLESHKSPTKVVRPTPQDSAGTRRGRGDRRPKQGGQPGKPGPGQGEYELTPWWYHKGKVDQMNMKVRPVLMRDWFQWPITGNPPAPQKGSRGAAGSPWAIFSPSKVRNWAGDGYAGLNVVRKSIISEGIQLPYRSTDFYRVVCLHCNRASRVHARSYYEVYSRGPRRLIICRSCLNEYKLIERQNINCPTTGVPAHSRIMFSPDMLTPTARLALDKFGFLDDNTFKATYEGDWNPCGVCNASRHLAGYPSNSQSALVRTTGARGRILHHTNVWGGIKRLIDSSMFEVSVWNKNATLVNQMIALFNATFIGKHPPNEQMYQREDYGPDFAEDIAGADVPRAAGGNMCPNRTTIPPTEAGQTA